MNLATIIETFDIRQIQESYSNIILIILKFPKVENFYEEFGAKHQPFCTYI